MELQAFLLHQEPMTTMAVGPKGVIRDLHPAPITILIAAKRIKRSHFSAMRLRSSFVSLLLTTHTCVCVCVYIRTHVYNIAHLLQQQHNLKFGIF